MRAVIQRVMNASVSVDGTVISSIGRGLLVLVGVSRDDTEREIDYLVRKILNIRLFEDDEGRRWSKSVIDYQFPVLCVSQFTLYAVLKGNKPDYHQTMAGEQSREFYHLFLTRLRHGHKPDLIKDGQFGAYMQVSLQNDGPVTITLDSADMGQDNRVKKPMTGARGQLATATCPSNEKTTAAPCAENKSTEANLASRLEDSLTVNGAEACLKDSEALLGAGVEDSKVVEVKDVKKSGTLSEPSSKQ